MTSPCKKVAYADSEGPAQRTNPRSLIKSLSFNQQNKWTLQNVSMESRGWSGVAKVSCILHHQGVQLILAYSWARPAVLAAGRGGMFNFCCVFTFIPFPLSPCPSLLSPQLSLLSLFSLSLGDDTK